MNVTEHMDFSRCVATMLEASGIIPLETCLPRCASHWIWSPAQQNAKSGRCLADRIIGLLSFEHLERAGATMKVLKYAQEAQPRFFRRNRGNALVGCQGNRPACCGIDIGAARRRGSLPAYNRLREGWSRFSLRFQEASINIGTNERVLERFKICHSHNPRASGYILPKLYRHQETSFTPEAHQEWECSEKQKLSLKSSFPSIDSFSSISLTPKCMYKEM